MAAPEGARPALAPGPAQAPANGATPGVFAVSAFRKLWLAGLLNGLVRYLEMLVIGVYVFSVTQSALTASLIAMMRLLPLGFSGVMLGAIAMHLGRRRLYLGLIGMLIVVWVVQCLLALTGRLEIWHLAVATLCAGVHWGAEMPLRRTMLGESVGREQLSRAMALDVASNNVTRMLGPLAGGLALQALGVAGAFLVIALMHLVNFIQIWQLDNDRPVGESVKRVFSGLVEGFRIARDNRTVVATLSITLVFNVFAFPASSMIPVLGEQRFALSALLVGVLQAAEGAGAFLGSLLILRLGRDVKRPTRLYRYGVLVYLLTILVVGVTPWAELAGTALLIGGLGIACFSTMQTMLIMLAVAPEARTRVMGLLTLGIGMAPFGFLNLGWMADHLGAGPALIIMAFEGLALWAWVAWKWPER